MDFPVLNQCPGYNLYIGGFIALRRPKALQNCHITHIVSVLDWQFEPDNPLTRGYKHLLIPVDDVEDENLLVWFPRSNSFIHDALTNSKPTEVPSNETSTTNEGNGVFIHCAMGKSRSATVLIAYLLWQSRQPSELAASDPEDDSMVSLPRQPLSVLDALVLLRKGRPIAEPNEGFMDQLHLYVDMGCPTTQAQLENHKLYKRWMNKRNVEESLRINRAPDMVDIQFEDEDSPSDSQLGYGKEAPPPLTAEDAATEAATLAEAEITIKCRHCRHLLASSAFTIPHVPYKSDPATNTSQGQDVSTRACAHIFLPPLSWMRETLSEGQLEGRLTCPNVKCRQNVGKFAWQGLKCSCGKWITPAFALARGRVDEAKSLRNGSQQRGSADPTLGGS
ncbi:hypothetical protein DV738_g2157, partial [Chaetothyriales sp. CBS 135597]